MSGPSISFGSAGARSRTSKKPNMTARVERLRDFVGLENANLLRIVAGVAEILQAQTVAGRKPSAEKVQEWLQQQIKWGLLHCPDTKQT